MSIEAGVLYVVATPIGNLGDISARALEILAEVDLIAAEDTRHSRNLLRHFGIESALMSLHDHNEQARLPTLLAELQAGKAIALISDAGTPLISDPGFRLVRELRENGIRVLPVPGPSSLLAGLSVSGLPTDRFAFEGFLPAKAAARRQRLQTLQDSPYTVVFFESSHRIRESVTAMAEVFGAERLAFIGRELTKRFEETVTGTLTQLNDWLAQSEVRRKGEFVVIIQSQLVADSSDESEAEALRVLTLLLGELPLKRAVALAAEITGIKKNHLYQQALALQQKLP